MMKRMASILLILLTGTAALAAAPEPFFLVAPTNGATGVSTFPALDWQDSTNATSYEVYLATNNPPAKFGSNQVISSCSPTNLKSGCTYYWYIVATNSEGSSRAPESDVWSFTTWCVDTTLTANITISTNNTAYDGKSIIINCATVTINGAHSFSNLYLVNGAKITHSNTTTNIEYRLDLSISNELVIATNCSIDVSSKGYLAKRTYPNTTNNASTYECGGSYGGLGGGAGANAVYGDFRDPNELGSGGWSLPGGGLARVVTGHLRLDGVIRANGGTIAYGAGSGGGIRLEVSTLSGGGSIESIGGSGYQGRAGGGGGRIAIYYGQLNGFDLSNRVSAAGGTDSPVGAPGTIYLKRLGDRGSLVIDRMGAGTRAASLWLPEGTNYLEEVVIRGTGTTAEVLSTNIAPTNMVVQNWATLVVNQPWRVSALNLTNGAVLTHSAATTTNEYKLDIQVLGTLSVSSNSSIDVSSKGYLAKRTYPNTTNNASTYECGGSYGGLGGGAGPNALYGDFRDPNELGSGGWALPGGGLARVVAGLLQLDGVIRANGGTTGYGAGSGGGIRLDVGILSGGGSIESIGGAGTQGRASGGGGRIAIYYEQLNGFDLSNRVSAAGGAASPVGAPGTIYLKKMGDSGSLVFDRMGGGAGVAWLWLPAETNYFEPVMIQGTGLIVNVAWPTNVLPPEIVVRNWATLLANSAFTFSNLTFQNGAVLTHSAATTTNEYRLDIQVLGTLSVSSNSSIDVSSKGYLAGRTYPNTTTNASTGYSGGSYGGLGGNNNGSANPVYGDYHNPNELGSGGTAGPGGGLVRLTAGTLVLEGRITASGPDGSYARGSGGGIYLDVGRLTGGGQILAAGGRNTAYGCGGGGGGRVAIYYQDSDAFDLTGRVSALGGLGSPNGSSGTVYIANVAPVQVSLMTPSGHVRGPVEYIDLVFIARLNDDTLGLDDFALTGPEGSVALSSISPIDSISYRITLTQAATTEGLYTFVMGTNILTYAGQPPEGGYTNTFIVDDTVPAAPVVTNWPGAPATNQLRTTSVTLSGTREADSAVWVNGTQQVSRGTGVWSKAWTFGQGLSTLWVDAVDQAGNVSTTNEYRFYVDSVAPSVVGATPGNGANVNVAPTNITLTFNEAGSGLVFDSSMYSVKKSSISIPGNWSWAVSNLLRFTPSDALMDGSYSCSVTLKDAIGNTSSVYNWSFTVDRLPPATPRLNSVTTPTATSTQTITGIREANSAIYRGGVLAVASSASTNWSCGVGLAEGNNTFSFTARDAAGNESGSTNVSIWYDNSQPGQVSLSAHVEGIGTQITLDWTGYDEIANGGDIVRYIVYRHSAPFTDVGDAMPIRTNLSHNQTLLVTGLVRNVTNYYAVVAVDVTSWTGTISGSVSAAPRDTVAPPNPTGAWFDCSSTELTVHWSPSADPYGDRSGYRVDVGGVPEAYVAASELSFTKTGLAPSSNYVFTIRSTDSYDNVSAGLAVVGYTLLPNPTGLVVTPYDGYVKLTWRKVDPVANVSSYAVYVSPNDFTTVEGMTRKLTTTATNAAVAGLVNGVTNYFAVTAINKAGGETKSVTTTNAATVPDTTGPELSNLRWSGGSLSNVSLPGSFLVSASDPAGVSKVEFRIGDTLIGTSVGSSTNFSAAWDVAGTPSNGTYALTVVAYDTLGNTTTNTAGVTVNLTTPFKPVITSPAAGTTYVNRATLTLSGTGALYAAGACLSINGVEGTPETVAGSGNFTLIAALSEGTNTIQVVATNRSGSTSSSAKKVVLDATVPLAPVGLTATPKENGVIRLGWVQQPGPDIAGYLVYRAVSSFTSPAEAVLANSDNLVAESYYSDLPATNVPVYYRVAAVSRASNTSALSAEVSATPDDVAPGAVFTYGTDGHFDPASNRYASGHLSITVTVSEVLSATPFLSVTPNGSIPVPITLTRLSTSAVYTGTFNINDATPPGPAYVVFSGRDVVGNRGTANSILTIDTLGPVASELVVTPEAPIRNVSTNPTPVTAVLVFATNDMPVTTPQLSYRLSLSRTNETALSLSNLTTASWFATFVLPTNAGQSAENLEFIYRGVDDLANTGTTILTESRFQVYQGNLPPLDEPSGLTGIALPGGIVRLTWTAVSGAADYQVYRGSTSNAVTTFVAQTGGALTFEENAGDATSWYGVASVRVANGETSVSSIANAVRVVADATAPAVPSGLQLSVSGSGVRLAWSAVSGDNVTYTVYRGPSAGSLTTLQSAVTALFATDAHPLKGPAYYAVSAVDLAGNESALSATVYTNVALQPVNSLSVTLTASGVPQVSWSHPDVAGIAGYNLYLGESGAEIALATGLLTSVTNYADTGYGLQDRRYVIEAFDAYGVKSAARSIRLPAIRAQLDTNSVLKRGIINRLYYTVANDSPFAVTNATLSVRVLTNNSVSAAFSVGAHSTATTWVVAGGYSNLADYLVLTNTLTIVPNAGETVRIVSSHGIEVGDDLLVAEVLSDSFTRGANGQARFTLHNTSAETIDILMSKTNGGSPEVRFKLETEDGNVFASVPTAQWQSPVMNIGGGMGVARIPPGGDFTSASVTIPVSTSAPDRVVLRLEIDKVHYDLGEPDHVSIGGLNSTRILTLAETLYTASVTNVTPASSLGETNVLIEGNAANRTSGAPQANVPVKLVISLNGFERTYSVYTDAGGHWAFSFAPEAGESGVYKVWAVHPDITDKPEQGQFSIYRLLVKPTAYNVSIPTNYQQKLVFSASASAGFAVTNLHVEYRAEDQPSSNLLAGVHVTNAPIAVLAGGRSTNLQVTIWGDGTASGGGTLVLRLSSDGGPANSWALLTVKLSLVAAPPVLDWTPSYVDTAVAISDSISETLTLTNRGFNALQNVSLAVLMTDGSPAPEWVRLNAAASVSELAGGGSYELSITFAPTSSVAEAAYEFKLHVTAANYPPADIPVYVGVDNSGVGAVLFHTINLYYQSGYTNGGYVDGVGRARIWLKKDTGTQYETNLVTSVSSGMVTVADLPVGSYRFQVTADKHSTYSGRLWIKPGIVLAQEVFLEYNPVTVAWSVVPTTIQDQYNIVLTAMFDTIVPAPVVVIDPPSVTLPDMKAGDVYNGEFKIINHGLIRAEDVKLPPPADSAMFKFEFLGTIPDVLEAQQVVRVPYRVTCLQSVSGSDSGGSATVCGSSFICTAGTYGYRCQNGNKGSGSVGICWGICRVRPPIPPGGQQTFITVLTPGAQRFTSTPGTSVPGKKGVPCVPPCYTCPCPTVPVNSTLHLAGGVYEDDAEDLSVQALGHRIGVSREYRGGTWTYSFESQNLGQYRSGTNSDLIGVVLEHTYYERQDGVELVYVANNSRILPTAPGLRWEDASGNWRNYNTNGLLMAYGDRIGRQVIYGYDATTSHVTAIFDHYTNQVMWIEYDSSNRVSSVKDRATGGRQVNYQYDNRGNLTNVIDVVGYYTAYGYDGANRMVYRRKPSGYETHVAYIADQWVSSVTDGEGKGKSFEYDGDPGSKTFYSCIRSTSGDVEERWFTYVEDGHLNQATYTETKRTVNGETVKDPPKSAIDPIETRDEQGNVTKIAYPDGTSKTFEYEGPYFSLSKEVNELGVTSLYQYDARGNLTNKIEAAGTSLERVTRYAYDEMDNKLSETRVGTSTNYTTSWTYDVMGNVLTGTDPLGNVTSNTYDYIGNLTSIRDPEGNVVSNVYDAAGHLVCTRDPLGRAASNVYDVAGNLVTNIDVNSRVTSYDYDLYGHLVKQTDPFGRVETRTYDAKERLVSVTDSEGKETQYEYDSEDRLIRTSDSNGRVSTTEYDSEGRITETVDPDGNTTVFSYDPATGLKTNEKYATYWRDFVYDVRGQLISSVDHVMSELRTNAFAYDAAGNTLARTDAEGRTISWIYDLLGRQIETVDARACTNQVRYSLWGSVTNLVDANGNVTRFEYDANDRLIRKTYADGSEVSYEYDGVGRLTRRVDAKRQMTLYAYNVLGQLVTNNYYAGTNAAEPDKSVIYSYDGSGRMISYNDGVTAGTYTYDDSNRTVSVSVNYGNFSRLYTYQLDAYGRKTELVGPQGVTNDVSHESE